MGEVKQEPEAVRRRLNFISEMSEIIEIRQAEMLQAINRSEIDMQVATAKAYPRDIKMVLNTISTYAKMDKETAEECFYVLRRGGSTGSTSIIEGVSVRMAEIIAGAWGNLRVQTRIIGNDGKTITAQGVCHDLETNLAVSVEVKRRITDKNGKTYSEDMQVVTGNAAAAIAFRNAVMKVVPKAVTKKVIDEVKQVALGNALDLETSRQNVIAYFAKLGVTEQTLLDYLGIQRREQIDADALYQLRGTRTAIEECTTTVEETFVKPMEEKRQAEAARKKAEENKARAEKAMAKAKKGTDPANVDEATGEIIPEGESK